MIEDGLKQLEGVQFGRFYEANARIWYAEILSLRGEKDGSRSQYIRADYLFNSLRNVYWAERISQSFLDE